MSTARPALALVVFLACTDATTSSPEAPSLPSLAADPAEPTGCVSEAPPGTEALAMHIRCPEALLQGPLAMGRVGDVVLWNAHARYILRNADESATTIGAPGGGVVDAAPAGRSVDGVKEVLPVLNLHGLALGPLTVVRARGVEAVVRARFVPRPLDLIQTVIPSLARRPAVRGVIEYALSAGDPVLRVRVCALPEEGNDMVPARPGLVVLLGGASEVLAPGTGVLAGEMATATTDALLAESPLAGYGARLDGSTSTILHVDTVSLVEATQRAVFSRAALGCTSMRWVTAATEADAARALSPGAGAELSVPSGGRAEFRDREGRVLLRSRELAGRVRAPPGAELSRTQIARDSGRFGPMDAVPATGVLRVETSVREEPGAPVRITVRGLDAPFERRWVSVGELRIALPTGRFRVSASRGSEYDIAESEVTVPEGETWFRANLSRVVDTAGEVATDFHLHTELSTDSVHPVGDAVRQMAAEGLEAVAATDHDFISDHASAVEASDVRGWILAVSGEEVSTTRLGHYGGYPLRRDVARAGAGAVAWFGLSPSQIFGALRERGDDVVVQVNHPRLRGSGVFDQIGLDAVTATTHGDPESLGLPAGTDLSDLSFDAVEVWNGYTRGGNERSFTDWLSLRSAGRRFVMVGNSDSHRPDRAPGAPRSYVRVPDDRRGRFTWRDVRDGLRAGDVRVSAGLTVQATVGDVRPGGTVHAVGGRVSVHVRVQAPAWVECTRLRVYRGVEVVIDQPIRAPREQVVRFEGDLSVPVAQAGFVVVRADGDADAEPVFSFAPFGVSNPIEVLP